MYSYNIPYVLYKYVPTPLSPLQILILNALIKIILPFFSFLLFSNYCICIVFVLCCIVLYCTCTCVRIRT